jgi:carbamoylphosphate synthase large subunit
MGIPGEMEARGVVNKGAVLALARRHIEALEKSMMSLEGGKEILMGKRQRLEGVLVKLGAEIMH